MNMIERISYIAMSEIELKKAIHQNSRLLMELQINCPSSDFLSRLFSIALAFDIDNLPKIITPGYSDIIIESLRLYYHSERDIATILISDLSSKAIDQNAIDFVVRNEKSFNVSRIPIKLLSIDNVLAMVKADNAQIGYIPCEVFTPEMSLEVFKIDAGAYCCVSPEVSTESIVLACTTPAHLALLDDEHFNAFYEKWRKDEHTLEAAFSCPASVGMTVSQYQKFRGLANVTAAQKATRMGALRLMKQAMLDIGVKDCWHCANTPNLVDAVKEVFGEALLSVEGLPSNLKREFLSDSLGM